MGENKLIVRRLVSGILLILFALLAFAASNMDAFLRMATNVDISAIIGAYRILAIAAMAIGIFFCASCKMRPRKIVEYSIAIIGILIFALVPFTEGYSVSAYLEIFHWAFIIILAVGVPFKNGYRGMPYQNKNENSLKLSTEKQLNDLKELLDDGTITQEEYDEKRKKILGI